MMEPHFEEEVGGFLSAHCDEFEEGENKLEYTAIFERYVAVLEAHIEKALAARVVGLDFSAFCAELLERGPSALGEQLNLDVLGSFGFEGFKELMLAEKRGRQCCGGLVGAPLPLHADEQEDGEAIPDLNLHITPVPSLWRHAQQPSGI
uniref:ADP-ribosylation factor-like protein 2-binding protein n=2 Tax=Emiliania huxleyi TaxID=2903 RepID=A0A6V2YDQ7_EMIHU|mmetsp:Transcript_26504/g.77779  ORF Transcript_26504/g.77779 Transcript_26504/m.77779 type:complete len:149 (-) Transcript_26504:243-689(-)